MSNTPNTPPLAPDFTSCPHWGKGGRYVVGPDGQRVPVVPSDAPQGDGVATEFIESAGTGEVMTAVSGDTLTSTDKPTRKGR